MNSSLLDELRQVLGADGLLTDASERLAYSYDNSRRQSLPEAVALPESREQLQRIVQTCRQHRTAITARGRGTNTTGASVPIASGVVVSFERMARLLAIRPGDRVAVVEPGLLNGDLQTALRERGLFWPPDPTSAPYCTIGGNLACNAGGPRAVKYGATRDNVLAITAITGTGDLVQFGAATTKGATGYDLSRLLVGSEGTLALFVEATLKLTPLAPERRALRALYRDVASAAAAVARLMAQPVTPSMLEFMDGDCVRLARDFLSKSGGGADLPEAGALLMIEADGDAATLPSAVSALAAAANGDGCLDVTTSADESARERLWAARKALSPALRTIAAGKINEDVVVPVSRLPDLVERVRAIATAKQTKVVCFGHAGNGNLHVNLLPRDEAERERAHACLAEVFALVIRLDGTLSGEHGIGLVKREFMPLALQPETLGLMRGVKAAFDPDGILNPRKLLP